MGDRTYARFAVPMSVLANKKMTTAVRHAFRIPLPDFQRVVLSEPSPEEAAGIDSFAMRLIEGRPFLVYEVENASYGGGDIENALCSAHVPFIQHNAAGLQYGPASTVYDGTTSEMIRLDHHLEPIAGIVLSEGRAVVDPEELAECEQYHHLRQSVLVWPAKLPRD